MPKVSETAPLIGPAILKSHAEAAGFKVTIFDANFDFYSNIDTDVADLYWNIDDTAWADERFEEILPYAITFVNQWIDLIKTHKPRYVGMSLLSVYSLKISKYFVEQIKLQLPDQKIIWGGPAVSDNLDLVRSLDIDWINGDSETAIVEYLSGRTHPAVRGTMPFQENDLDSIYPPNYSDFNFKNYRSGVAYITGSRGCVRNCSFCDVAALWPKYRFRSGASIVKEMQHVFKNYDIDYFDFTDSLVNGSMRAFRDMIHSLAELNQQGANIKWAAQFIARSREQMTEEDWTLTKLSGCQNLDIGIESPVAHIRDHMEKKFDDDAMWFTLNQAKKHDIKITLLTMIGYPTETAKDHEDTLLFYRELEKNGFFERSNPVITHVTASVTKIIPSTPLRAKVQEMGIIWKGDPGKWIYRDNTPHVRMQRHYETVKLLRELGVRKYNTANWDQKISSWEKQFNGKN